MTKYVKWIASQSTDDIRTALDAFRAENPNTESILACHPLDAEKLRALCRPMYLGVKTNQYLRAGRDAGIVPLGALLALLP